MSGYSDKEADQFIDELKQADKNGLNIKELLFLCISKWYWFVISLVITIGFAFTYLKTNAPVYTRSAALLIKDTRGTSAMDDISGVFSSIDIFKTSSNVNNEMQAIQSPFIMSDVVKLLNLNENHFVKGRFYKEVLYGQARPYEIQFLDLKDNEEASFTIEPGDSVQVFLSDFVFNKEKDKVKVEAALNDTVTTPVGRLVIRLTANNPDALADPVYVSRYSLQKTIDYYVAKLLVGIEDNKSTVINLSIDDVNIQRAEDVLNTLIAVYNEHWVRDRNQVSVSSSMFINERLSVIEQELGSVDEDISSYRSENLLPDIQATANMYMTRSNEANEQLMALNTQLSMASYIRNYLLNFTSENQLLPANSGIESSAIERLITEYNTMQLRRNELVASSSEKNPLVLNLDRSLKDMRGSIITSIDNHITTLNAQIASLKEVEEFTTERLAASPTQGKYLLSVERQQKVKESLYLYLLQKREENELAQAFIAYNTRVITPPSGSMEPSSPSKNKILLIAVFFGLFIPLIILLIVEGLNSKVRGRKDLETLSIPLVGEIPFAEGKKKAAGTSDRIIVKHRERDPINEAFRVLRTNLEFMLQSDSDWKASISIFTSFNPGSGKTFLTMNTAATLALKGKRILVIDGDLRHGSASAYIDSPPHGLSDYLGKRVSDINSLIHNSVEYPGLSVLPMGTIPPNPTELLEEPLLKDLLDELRGKYDYIFIDCPPIDIVADTQIIENLADRTIFVIRVGKVERAMLPELQRMYNEKRFKKMALLLNGTKTSNNRFGYRYGYSYGHGAGSSYYYSTKD